MNKLEVNTQKNWKNENEKNFEKNEENKYHYIVFASEPYENTVFHAIIGPNFFGQRWGCNHYLN